MSVVSPSPTPTNAPPSPTPALSERARIGFSLGAVLAILLAVSQEYLVSTAGPAIISGLDPSGGSAGALPWLMTTYALASTAMMPLLGAMCDTYGVRRVYLFSIWMFVIGSVLCGSAQSVTQMMVCRVVEGAGGGGLMSVTVVALSTVYPPKDRAGSAGLGSSVVGVGIVLGPLMGGIISEYADWRWVFYGNLLVAVPVAALMHRCLQVDAPDRPARIDATASTAIVGTTAALLLAAQWGGTTYAWASWQIVSLLVGGTCLLALFLRLQFTGRSEMLPAWLLRTRMFRLALPLEFFGGFALLVTPVYLGAYLQVVRGLSPTEAGLLTGCLAVGLVLTSVVSGRHLSRHGRYKRLLAVNVLVGVAGLLQLATLGTDSPYWSLCLALVALGVALGGVLQVVMLALQVHTPEDRVGTVTVNARFVAFLGQACGASLLGSIVARQVTHSAVDHGRVDLGAVASAHGSAANAVVHGYLHGLHLSYLIAAAALLVGLAFALRMPDARLVPESVDDDVAAEGARGAS